MYFCSYKCLSLFRVSGLEQSQYCLSILMQRNRPAMVNFLYDIVEQVGNFTYQSLHLEYLEQYIDIHFLSWLIWLFTPIIVSYQIHFTLIFNRCLNKGILSSFLLQRPWYNKGIGSIEMAKKAKNSKVFPINSYCFIYILKYSLSVLFLRINRSNLHQNNISAEFFFSE